MRADRVVVPPPAFRHDLRFLERVEQLTVQELFPHLAIKRFDIAIFPGRLWLDIARRHLKHLKPVSQLDRDALRSNIRPNMHRDPTTQKQIRSAQEHVV